MHADERLSTLGHASGSAEVAAQALAAVRAALAGRTLSDRHQEALRTQAELIDLLASDAIRTTSSAAARAAMLAQEGPSTLKSLRTLSDRLAELNNNGPTFAEAGNFLRTLAQRTTVAELDRALGENVATLCKRLLIAALEIVGSATRAPILDASGPPKA
jgi:hypothetical protein